MKTIIFAVAGYNLAETGRMIEIARAAREHFNILFISYGGQFERLIRSEGFELREMEPRLTPEKLDRLQLVLNGETWNTVGYFSADELAPRVKSEIRLFEEIRPAAVLPAVASDHVLDLEPVLLVERQYPIMEEIHRGHAQLREIQFPKRQRAVGVRLGLVVDLPNTLDRAQKIRVLAKQIARMWRLDVLLGVGDPAPGTAAAGASGSR